MPSISLVYLTYRPGGIDLLVESLKHQRNFLYELIVIDDWEGRVERGKAQEYILSKKIPLRYYGTSDYGNFKRNGPVRAFNVGAIHATTNYVVLVSDYVWFPPGAVVQWLLTANKLYSETTLVSGIANIKECEPPQVYDDISIWKDPYPRNVENIQDVREEWIPHQFDMFYCGLPMSFLEAINGLDETMEYVANVVFQAGCHGYDLVVDKKLRIDAMNHRDWKDPRFPELWLCKRSKDKKNFMLSAISPNPYNFKELRDKELAKYKGKQ